MKKIIFLTIIFLQISLAAQEKIYNMTNKQIDSLLTVTATRNMTITERMNFYSEMFLKMPYNLTCTGDGPYALYETEPLVNFKQTNCMVFCEHVLALSISDSWDNFFNNLQQIRYKDGIIGMRTRNHYTMVDWLPENNWLLHDITKIIGGEKAKSLTRTISHKKFFVDKKIKDMRYVKPDRTVTIDFISFTELQNIKSKLKAGDIFSLIFANKDDIFSAHMLMIMEKSGKLVVRESALTPKTTLDTPFDEWVKKFLNSKNYCGVSFMRVNDHLNTPGKIILPWEIQELKKK
ncbi:MAG: hypothetical protein CO129_09315 [Ignavibacteriales bacterium CG_4_9_14_3_um_filter_34_10]|nr:MAG: hypothetical protein CO129_09315 [Ignavibacteriales bacterium CG_4_9_14_3_um_filter_34_10]